MFNKRTLKIRKIGNMCLPGTVMELRKFLLVAFFAFLSVTNGRAEPLILRPLILRVEPLPEEKITISEKKIYIPKFKTPPFIDGKLNEECWEKAAKAENFLCLFDNKLLVKEQTEVFLGYDHENLYLAFVCFESEIDKLRAQSKIADVNDSQIWFDDCIEIFLDTNLDRSTYYQIIVNSKGMVYDASYEATYCRDGTPVYALIKEDASWDSHILAKTSVGSDRWIVEVSLPLSSLAERFLEGNIMGINLCRHQIRLKEASNWAGVRHQDNHDPKGFGHLIFAQSPWLLKATQWGPEYFGKDRVKITVKNNRGKKGTIKMRLEREDSKEQWTILNEKVSEIGKGREEELSLDYLLKEEKEKLRVSLVNPQTEEIYAQDEHFFSPSPELLEISFPEGRNYYLSKTECPVEVKINVGGESLKEFGLRIGLVHGGSPLAEGKINELTANRLSLMLDISGLKEATYTLEFDLIDEKGSVIYTHTTRLNKIEGW